MKKMICLSLLFSLFIQGMSSFVPLAAQMNLSWDFPEKWYGKDDKENQHQWEELAMNGSNLPYEMRSADLGNTGYQGAPRASYVPANTNLPVQCASAEFDPILEPGMILVITSVDQAGNVQSQSTIPIMHDEVVSIPGVGVMDIVGKKLSFGGDAIRKFTGQNFKVCLLMGNVQTVQVLGKVQKPGNYAGYMKLSFLLAEAMDRAPGSNFKISFYNGANRQYTILRYEDIVKGKTNPLVPPGSIIYAQPGGGTIFGEMTDRQMSLLYTLASTLSVVLSVIAVSK